ncbi:helix-turn-helix transcriptional regulator [Pediococcus acidilactici]|jgi:transcriptional regulator with XRE-family HTH domain|uniref:Helix-turn-helix transcriptional regulator n=1 Tax=Pediococcus acidilactici TaxID=1254 RepID=A0AAW8YNV4_PEDAC|nr:helix-turn-helix transcriptional regulator [Pediococcus acidilactici]KAF0362562.1 helix-turn-helix domain-containing protein [Pediococcus acidilactici]KAF0368148.1 helix-turn-helix domain-containing protein [Pediococcus acidilactici]KAF0372787.1 helix-turn-helix domain-containing protein [Pediococcus acidilactici]KAF0383342.1 helix-turn-helix domain-containing protein [Pediococcus acidilactici]KAF0417266.1 helix-turn-helix domain-containing protein [Pediococcus acidilactici]
MIVSCIKPKRVNLERIKELREKNNLTKSKMAQLMGFKTTEKYSRRESGEYSFQVDELPVLSEIFHVKIEKFFE